MISTDLGEASGKGSQRCGNFWRCACEWWSWSTTLFLLPGLSPQMRGLTERCARSDRLCFPALIHVRSSPLTALRRVAQSCHSADGCRPGGDSGHWAQCRGDAPGREAPESHLEPETHPGCDGYRAFWGLSQRQVGAGCPEDSPLGPAGCAADPGHPQMGGRGRGHICR